VIPPGLVSWVRCEKYSNRASQRVLVILSGTVECLTDPIVGGNLVVLNQVSRGVSTGPSLTGDKAGIRGGWERPEK